MMKEGKGQQGGREGEKSREERGTEEKKKGREEGK